MDALRGVLSQPPLVKLTSVLTQLSNDLKSSVALQDIVMGWLFTANSLVTACGLAYCTLLSSGGERDIEDLHDSELTRILREHRVPFEDEQFDRAQMLTKVKQLWVSHYRKMLCRAARDLDKLRAPLMQMSLDALRGFGERFGISLGPSNDKMGLVVQLIQFIQVNSTIELSDVSSSEPVDPSAIEEVPSAPPVQEERFCWICFEEDVQFAYFACCGHSETCVTCFDKLDTCPICRKSIEPNQ